MKHNLKISVSKKPENGGIVACRQISVRERLVRFLLGNKQKLTVILPGDTVKLKDEVSKVSSDLSILRGLAEREAANQITTASISVDMNNTHYLSSEMDLDGMINTLTKSVNESMAIAAEGAHI